MFNIIKPIQRFTDVILIGTNQQVFVYNPNNGSTVPISDLVDRKKESNMRIVSTIGSDLGNIYFATRKFDSSREIAKYDIFNGLTKSKIGSYQIEEKKLPTPKKKSEFDQTSRFKLFIDDAGQLTSKIGLDEIEKDYMLPQRIGGHLRFVFDGELRIQRDEEDKWYLDEEPIGLEKRLSTDERPHYWAPMLLDTFSQKFKKVRGEDKLPEHFYSHDLEFRRRINEM